MIYIFSQPLQNAPVERCHPLNLLNLENPSFPNPEKGDFHMEKGEEMV